MDELDYTLTNDVAHLAELNKKIKKTEEDLKRLQDVTYSKPWETVFAVMCIIGFISLIIATRVIHSEVIGFLWLLLPIGVIGFLFLDPIINWLYGSKISAIEYEKRNYETQYSDLYSTALKKLNELKTEIDATRKKKFGKMPIIIESTIETCGICLGNIKAGAPNKRCACNRVYHQACADRVGVCPTCGGRF